MATLGQAFVAGWLALIADCDVLFYCGYPHPWHSFSKKVRIFVFLVFVLFYREKSTG